MEGSITRVTSSQDTIVSLFADASLSTIDLKRLNRHLQDRARVDYADGTTANPLAELDEIVANPAPKLAEKGKGGVVDDGSLAAKSFIPGGKAACTLAAITASLNMMIAFFTATVRRSVTKEGESPSLSHLRGMAQMQKIFPLGTSSFVPIVHNGIYVQMTRIIVAPDFRDWLLDILATENYESVWANNPLRATPTQAIVLDEQDINPSFSIGQIVGAINRQLKHVFHISKDSDD